MAHRGHKFAQNKFGYRSRKFLRPNPSIADHMSRFIKNGALNYAHDVFFLKLELVVSIIDSS